LNSATDFRAFGITPDQRRRSPLLLWCRTQVITDQIANGPSSTKFKVDNLAVGGGFDPGAPPNPEEFPKTFDIDYIRVYKEKDTP